MDRLKIDLLKAKYSLDTPRERGVFLFPRLFLGLLVIVAVFGIAFSSQVSTGTGSGTPIGIFGTIARLVRSGDRMLRGEDQDRINFLFLGVGGAGHEGAELSDTIMFASLKPSTKEVGILSIPRDTAVPIPGYGSGKINSVNAIAEAKQAGTGPIFASQVIGDLLQQPVDYYVKVNFDGFEELINQIGGVDVYVDRTFTDSNYPVLGMEDANCDQPTTASQTDGSTPAAVSYTCRYETLHFEQGWQHMDGATALKYARSRHGDNGEGGDFARAARQQKIILAVKAKALSAATLLNPTRIVDLVNTLSKNIQTNLSAWEIVKLATYLPEVSNDHIVHHVLDDGPGSPLYSAIINEAYVLLPVNDDWKPIQTLAANIFTSSSSSISPSEPSAPAHTARIEIQNGTDISGLASQAAALLKTNGFEVTHIGNASNRGYQHTVIYDLTNGTMPDDLKALVDLLQADVNMSAAGWVFTNKIVPTQLSVSSGDEAANATDKNIDFLVILGENTANLVLR